MSRCRWLSKLLLLLLLVIVLFLSLSRGNELIFNVDDEDVEKQQQQQQQQNDINNDTDYEWEKKIRTKIRHERSRVGRGFDNDQELKLQFYLRDEAIGKNEEDDDDVEKRRYQDWQRYNGTESYSNESSEDYDEEKEKEEEDDDDYEKIFPSGQVDIVTRFLRIIENQHLLGENCTAGTDLNLGEGVVDQYAQERFRLEAKLAVNRANMLTRLWKYAPDVMQVLLLFFFFN